MFPKCTLCVDDDIRFEIDDGTIQLQPQQQTATPQRKRKTKATRTHTHTHTHKMRVCCAFPLHSLFWLFPYLVMSCLCRRFFLWKRRNASTIEWMGWGAERSDHHKSKRSRCVCVCVCVTHFMFMMISHRTAGGWLVVYI